MYYHFVRGYIKSNNFYCIENKVDDPLVTRSTDENSAISQSTAVTLYTLVVHRCNQKEQDDMKTGVKCSSSAEVDA